MRTESLTFPTTAPQCVADDEELVRLAADGDHRAFEQIMRRYNQRLYRLAVALLGEPSEAEDVLQESYVRAYYRLASFAGRSSLGAWLAGIVRHEAIDRIRARASRGRRIALEADLDGGGASLAIDGLEAPVSSDPQIDLERREMRRLLESAVARLPDPFRAVFVLREVEGLSVQETAEYLGVPAATVKTRDHRARAILRRELTQQIGTAMPRVFPFLGAQCDALVERVIERLRG